MKTVINNTLGVVTYRDGDKIILESTDEIQIKGDLTIAGTTTTNARVDDRIIELAHGTTGSRSSGLEDSGIIVERGDDDNVFFGWDESEDMFSVGTGSFTGTSTNLSLTLAGMKSQTLTAAALTGSSTITVPASGLVIGSTAVDSTAAELNLLDGSAKSTSSITIADADAILIIDGNTTKQIPASDLKTYVGSNAGGTSLANLDIDGGTDIGAALVDADLLIVDDGASGTNRKTAMSRVKTYVSDLTLTTAAQTNVTSLGTLTALTVDNIALDGATIGHTSDTDLITLADGVVTVAGEVSVTTLDIGGTNVTATAAELNTLSGIASNTTALNYTNVTPGTAAASKALVLDSSRDIANINSLTATTLAGTLSTAAQTNVTSLGTLSALTISGDLTVDTSTLKVDSSNDRVGIGTASPQNPLHIVSSTGDAVKIDRAGGVNVVLRNTSAGTGFQMTNAGVYGQFSHGGTATMNLKGGNVGIGTTTFDGSSEKYLTIANGTSPAAATADQIYIGSKDGSGISGATLALFSEQTVDSTALDAVGTLSHRITVWINGTEYYLYLDPV